MENAIFPPELMQHIISYTYDFYDVCRESRMLTSSRIIHLADKCINRSSYANNDNKRYNISESGADVIMREFKQYNWQLLRYLCRNIIDMEARKCIKDYYYDVIFGCIHTLAGLSWKY
ncbi:hypothetical protein D5b_00443 [Faustovirus]|nr:hypothetical protein D5b_00443 [Faustovirus]AMN84476.1 hypothetical protein D6_00065 [Faustovirus]